MIRSVALIATLAMLAAAGVVLFAWCLVLSVQVLAFLVGVKGAACLANAARWLKRGRA